MRPIEPEQYIQRPYEFFCKHREKDPVAWIDFFHGEQVWLVTGYEEAEAMMKDTRFVRDGSRLSDPGSRQAKIPDKVQQVMAMKNNMILVRDAPFHTRVRGLLGKAFTPAMIRQLQPSIEAIAAALLREMSGKRQHELIADFAYRLPMYVISDLIGVPQEDRHYSQRWSEAFISFIDFHRTMDELDRASDEMLHAREYFKELVASKRRHPVDDIVSHLAMLQDEGGPITEEEIVASCVLLLSAGHETTVNLIANGYYLLLRHPEQCRRLQEDWSLLPNAVEEMLRYEPPALTSSRWVSEDIEFYGHTLRKGQFVIIALGGANRDPRAMTEPDRFDIGRKPVKHLSFASGAHYCLGAPLARLEGLIAIKMLVSHLKHPILLEEPVWKNSIALRGFQSLQIAAEVDMQDARVSQN
ncbi:MAG: cytochrome P450 [Paenibacillaceae bacterium]|nr:cytochrome P450 [Paenibacillaceae bacterium]